MPSTVAGLAIFVAFVLPGFVHYLRRSRRTPERKLTVAVETAYFVAVSTATNVATIVIFWAVRGLLPERTPDVQLLVEQGGQYAYPRIGYIFAWGVALLLISCALANLVGSGKIPFLGDRTPLVSDGSAWHTAFAGYPRDIARASGGDLPEVFVGCELDSGSYVEGYLRLFSNVAEDVADRDLILGGGVRITDVAGNTRQLGDETSVILSGRSVRRTDVTYVLGDTTPVSPNPNLSVPSEQPATTQSAAPNTE